MNLLRRDGLIAFPFHWQVPAATEKTAYESVAAAPDPLSFEYIGFPWATIVDGLCRDAAITAELLMALKLAGEVPAESGKRVTVAQHIHAMKFVELFKACGITDVFWPHTTHQQHEIEGIRLHPFPLFPAQTPEASAVDLERPRSYLANFIGAYNPKAYLTNVREVIFNDANEAGDLLIIKRDAWHFERTVYQEQIEGRRADEQRLLVEKIHTEEYLNAIRDSWFTLCPTGSGPNSIRIFESLCLGSIPIVLTRDLWLPGPQASWEKAAIIEDDSRAGYTAALDKARRLSPDQRIEKLKAGQQLLQLVGPRAYGVFIKESVALAESNLRSTQREAL